MRNPISVMFPDTEYYNRVIAGFPSLLIFFRFALRSVVFCGGGFPVDYTDIEDIIISGLSLLRYPDLDMFLDIGELASFRFILFTLKSHPDG